MYELPTSTLRSKLDPGSKVVAAQDFHHASQEENEKVGDFACRLEQLFKLAYIRPGHHVRFLCHPYDITLLT